MPFGELKYVLVVEDDIDLRSTIVLTLQREGYPVFGAADGVEALTLLANPERHLPALMITNINMPVMSGSLLLHVMQMCPKLADLPVVIASGQDKVVYSDKYKMLKKPYSIQDVIEIVKEYVPKVNGAVKHAI